MKTLRLLLTSWLHQTFAGRAAFAANDEVAPEAETVAVNEVAYGVDESGVMKVPFCEQQVIAMVNGRETRVLQRIDAEAANNLVADMADPLSTPGNKTGLLAKIGAMVTTKLGRPIFWGHPDHPNMLTRDRYPDKRARGFVVSIEAANDSIRLIPDLNTLGKKEVGDRQVFGHSPSWSLTKVMKDGRQEIKDGMPVMRPLALKSVGLTNTPNIPGAFIGAAANEDAPAVINVSKVVEALKEAGIAMEGDDELSVLTGIANLKEQLAWNRDRKASDEARLKMLRGLFPMAANEATEADLFQQLVDGITAANEAVAANEAALDTLKREQQTQIEAANEQAKASRTARVDDALNHLIKAGRVTGAQKDALRAELIEAANEEAVTQRLGELATQKPRLGLNGGVTDELKADAKKVIMAANEQADRQRLRNEARTQAMQEITRGGAARDGDEVAAWNLARSRHPDLFK